MYDITIIGAGAVGSAIARELSKYKLKLAVLERASDVCEGTSKANSGIAHAGYDAMPGTLKAKLNVRGSELMEGLSEELRFLYRRCGSLVLCFDEEQKDRLFELKERGEQNGVKELEIISGDKVRELEPNLSTEVKCALYAPTGAIVDPFGLTIAMAENAAVNGAEFHLNTEVTGVEKHDGFYRIYVKRHASKSYESAAGIAETLHQNDTGVTFYDTRIVINAAGVYADTIHNMVSKEKIKITPRRGEYMLLDNSVGAFMTRTVFQLPTSLGKGILITPTTHGNILVGPNAEDIEDKEALNTTASGLSSVRQKALLSAPELPLKQVITSFAGLRARVEKRAGLNNFEDNDTEGDFLIGEVKDAPGFIDAAGIESPGLTCAPAIGEYVTRIIERIMPLEKKNDFIKRRELYPEIAKASSAEAEKLIKKDPLYANIICRCLSISEGEIMSAIHRPLGAYTSDGIKRRTYAGMGRCQSGFCNPKVVEILSRELSVSPEYICKNDTGSEFLVS